MSEREIKRPLEWKLLYTKVHCEAWAEANLRNQGFLVVLPRDRERSGFGPLFPRYVFVGHEVGADPKSLSYTRGVLQVVQFGSGPARVPQAVIDEIRGRMDAHGVVHLADVDAGRPIFDRRQRERVRALVKLASAGFRVREAS